MQRYSTVIFLFRHGQTDSPYSSDPLIDNKRILTTEGERQLEKVGEYLKSFMPSAIYCSPRKRTMQSAQIIADKIGVQSINEVPELLEVYTDSSYQAAYNLGKNFLSQLSLKHNGEHIVCVSHQDVIEQAIRGLAVSDEEAEFPCKMSQGYRLVFAEDKFVEITKINPANAI